MTCLRNRPPPDNAPQASRRVYPGGKENAMEAPQNPAGPYTPELSPSPERRRQLIAEIADLPARLRRAVSGLSPDQLGTKYRNWTVRQIAHHLADSHVNALVRFKLALT